MIPQSINASASPETQMNENFQSIEHQFVYAIDPRTSSGLNLTLFAGRWGGIAFAGGDYALTDDDGNYVVVNRSTGVPSVSIATTNWDDTTNYARLYIITVASGAWSIDTDVEDHRAGPNGVHGTVGAGTGTIGRHAVPVLASAMAPRSTNGCAALAVVAAGSGQPDMVTLDFDPSTQEYAQFSIPMPKSWNEGTVTFKPIWSHPATTTNFGVVWSLKAVAVGNDDTMAAAFGTEQTSTDTGGTTDDLYIGPESSAITIAGTPAAEDVVFFQVSREVGNGSDTMAVDARLHGIVLYITTAAETDA